MDIWNWNYRNYWCSFLVIASLYSLSVSQNLAENLTTGPYSPRILCSLLPEEFVVCSTPKFVNKTIANLTEFQCPVNSQVGQQYSEVKRVSVLCKVVDETIQCAGNRTFVKENYPCIRYSGYCFVTVLLQSIFLGCLGIDRFCLGYTSTAVPKLLTLGGLGIWWIVDIVLLLTGNLLPSDGSSWCVYY